MRRRVSRAGRQAAWAIVLVAAALSALADPAWAQGEVSRWGGNDWYVGAHGIGAFDNADPGGAKGDLDPSWGVSLLAGFRRNRWLAFEGQAEYIRKFNYSRRGESGGGLMIWNVMTHARLYATQDRIQPFLLAGGGFLQKRDTGGGSSRTGNAFAARFGGGVEVFINESLATTLATSYVLGTGEASDRDYVSVQLGLLFY